MLAWRFWLTLRITLRYSRSGGEVYSATIGRAGDLGPGGERRGGVVAQRRGVDPDPPAPEGLDEQRPGEGGRVLDLVGLGRPACGPTGTWPRTVNRRGPTAWTSTEAGPLRPTVSTRASTATNAVSGTIRTRAGSPAFAPGRDEDVDDVVVDHDRRDPRRAAAGARGVLEQPVVDQDVAGDRLDPGGVDLAGQVGQPGQRVARHERGVGVAPGVGVVVVLEQRACRPARSGRPG